MVRPNTRQFNVHVSAATMDEIDAAVAKSGLSKTRWGAAVVRYALDNPATLPRLDITTIPATNLTSKGLEEKSDLLLQRKTPCFKPIPDTIGQLCMLPRGHKGDCNPNVPGENDGK